MTLLAVKLYAIVCQGFPGLFNSPPPALGFSEYGKIQMVEFCIYKAKYRYC